MQRNFVIAIILIFGLCASSEAFENFPYEDCWPHIQPNNATFQARMFGAGLIVDYETSDGYTITYGPNGYMHYATLDSQGEYIPNDSVVAVNQPPTESFHLPFLIHTSLNFTHKTRVEDLKSNDDDEKRR